MAGIRALVFVLQEFPGIATAVAFRVSGQSKHVLNHQVKVQSVIKTTFHQLDEMRNRRRSLIQIEFDNDIALSGFQKNLRQIILGRLFLADFHLLFELLRMLLQKKLQSGVCLIKFFFSQNLGFGENLIDFLCRFKFANCDCRTGSSFPDVFQLRIVVHQESRAPKGGAVVNAVFVAVLNHRNEKCDGILVVFTDHG